VYLTIQIGHYASFAVMGLGAVLVVTFLLLGATCKPRKTVPSRIEFDSINNNRQLEGVEAWQRTTFPALLGPDDYDL
jgi:hypothetical protein